MHHGRCHGWVGTSADLTQPHASAAYPRKRCATRGTATTLHSVFQQSHAPSSDQHTPTRRTGGVLGTLFEHVTQVEVTQPGGAADLTRLVQGLDGSRRHLRHLIGREEARNVPGNIDA